MNNKKILNDKIKKKIKKKLKERNEKNHQSYVMFFNFLNI